MPNIPHMVDSYTRGNTSTIFPGLRYKADSLQTIPGMCYLTQLKEAGSSLIIIDGYQTPRHNSTL